MIKKHKLINRKSTTIFFSKRCAFLFFMFLVSLLKAQVFVGEGAVIYDSNNIITGTIKNAANTDEIPNTVHHSATDSPQIDKAEKPLNRPKKKESKILITKKEIIQKNIEKQVILNKTKKIDTRFSPNNGKGNSSSISSGKKDSSSALISYNHDLIADYPAGKYVIFIHSIIVDRLYSLLTSAYKNNVSYFYSVRPPPFC